MHVGKTGGRNEEVVRRKLMREKKKKGGDLCQGRAVSDMQGGE